jgi:hypothetical protein
MNSDHTNISPSQAERFFNCPGSVQAQGKIDLIEPSSPAALEGTAIHELAAKCMKQDIDPYDMIGETIEVKDNFGETIEFTVNDDFAFTVRMYRNTILGILGQHGLTQKALNIEAKCKIPEIDKYAKGTVDCSFIAGSTLYVFDLKGGRGVIVSPEENKQCMYYALRPFFDARMFIDRVVIGIIQPRAKEGEYIKMWETTPERLDAFAKELKDSIAKTRVKNPEFKAGDHCRWCKAEGNCPVVMDMMVAQVQAIAPTIESAFPKVTELTPEQIGNALPALEALKGILDTLQGYALSLASKGIDIPNYALTKGRKLRRYKDEQSVIDAFGEEMGEQLYETKLRTPAQLEKIVGKERLEDYVFTPEGDLKLVPTKEAKEFISRTVEQVFKDVQLTEGE